MKPDIDPYAEIYWRADAEGKRICTEALARSLERCAASLKRRPPELRYLAAGVKLR